MTYSVIQDQEFFGILEKDTKLIVALVDKENKARNLCRSLNLGSGFNGMTPEFMTIQHSQKKKKGNQ